MEFPNLQQKEQAEIITEKIEFNDIRKKGLMGNIDKKRTIINSYQTKCDERKSGNYRQFIMMIYVLKHGMK